MVRRVFSRRTAIGAGLAMAAAPLSEPFAAQAVPERRSLRVGVLLDTSGPASIHGKRQLLGVQHQARTLSTPAARLELLVRDTEGSVDTTVAQLKALLDNDIDAIIGTSMPRTAEPVVETAQAAGVPVIVPTTVSPPSQPFGFCCAATADQVARQFMRSIAGSSARRAGMLILDTLHTPQRLDGFRRAAAANGVELVAVAQFSAADGIPLALGALTGGSADAIMVVTPPPFNALAVKGLHELHWEGGVFCGVSAAHPGFLDIAGEAAEGVHVVAPWIVLGDRVPDTRPNSWAIREFTAGFTPRHGPVGTFAGYGADAVTLLHHAFAGHHDRTRARENLEHMTCVGVTGVVRMTPANHAGLDDDALTTVVVRNGTWAG